MIRRLGILLRKELAQHALVVFGLLLLMALIGLVQWAVVWDDPLATNQLAALGKTAFVFIPIAGLMLGHYVVVREFHGRAQLFLEALPLMRWEFVAAKFAFGYIVLAALTVTLELVMASAAAETDPRYLAIVAFRLLGYAAAWWSVFFTFGLLGRLRLPMYVAVAIALFVLQKTSNFEIERFAPLALVDSTLVYERETFPARQLLHTGLFSGLLLGLALALSLISEGSVAEVLARRASQREKSAFVVFLAVAGMVAGIATQKKKAEPFEFTSPYVQKSARSDVSVMYGWPDLEPSAAKLVTALERASNRFEHELGFKAPPPIRVAHQSALGAREIREQYLADSDGVLIETNLAPENLEIARVLYNSSHASFLRISGGRASLEPEHWFLDGFSAWWTAEQVQEERDRLWLRGLVAARSASLDPAMIASWEQFMQAHGEDTANGLAFTAVAFLAERHGRGVVLELARSHLLAPSHNALFAYLKTRGTPLSRRVAELTRAPWAEFVAAWREELSKRSTHGSWSERLRRLPRMAAEVRVEVGVTGARVVYQLSGEPQNSARDCALLHGAIEPYDVFVASDRLQREPVVWRAEQGGVEGELRGQYGSGQRVFLAVECYVPELAAPMRLRALRATVP